MKKFSFSSRSSAAFTLVEVLAALAVLSILLAVIMGLMTSATKTVSINTGRSESEEQVRLVFATMESDFARMVRRINADSVFKFSGSGTLTDNPQTSGTGDSDYMYFYSETPGYYDTSVVPAERLNLSLVGYLVETPSIAVTPRANTASETSYQYRLQRLARGLCWDDDGSVMTAPVFLTFPQSTAAYNNPTPPAPILGTTLIGKWPTEVYGPGGGALDMTNYTVLGSDVFRMEYYFIYSNGKMGDWAYCNDSLTGADTSSHIHGLQDVTGIVVTLAAIDESSRNLILTLKGIGGMTALATQFPDSNIGTPVAQPSATALPSSNWQNIVSSGSLAASTGLPASVVSQVRIYQHVFYLNKL